MGNQSLKNKKYLELKVDDKLSEMINKLIEEKLQNEKKNEEPKKNNNIANDETELNYKTITDLIDLIYAKNINMQLSHRGNRSVYEATFDIRNVMDNKEDLNNNKYNKKFVKIMKDIIEPKINEQAYIKSDKDNIDDYYINKDFFR